MPSRFVGDLKRAELLAELSRLRRDDGLDHVVEAHGGGVGELSALRDEDLRELLKLARMRQLIWRQQDE